MRLYRVFHSNPRAATEDPGGVLFAPFGGASRIDNPQLYRALYAAFEPECAIAELFGAIPTWTAEMLVHASGYRYALAALEVPDEPPLWNMPSDVVKRDRERTQAWAKRVFSMKRYRGIRWWSYYSPQWTSCGLWDVPNTSVMAIERLTIDSPALLVAAESIVRIASR